MKKHLMTTTALAAAGVLASAGAAYAQGKPSLTLGGWFEGIVGAVTTDGREASAPTHVAVDTQIDSEIHFNGDVRLDNGIRIRSKVELEGQSGNSGDQIDEAFLRISGKFGEVRIGSEDNAPHLIVTPMQGAWATNVGQNMNFDVADWIDPPAGMSAGNVNRLDLGDADSEKITYFTPRISGFQLGATYSPSNNEGQDGRPESRVGVFHEGYAVGATYQGKFDQVGFGLGAGYAEANPGVPNQSRPAGYVVAGLVDFGGFRVAAGYIREVNQTPNTAATETSSYEYNFGVRYKQGRNNFSIGYAHSEAEGLRANPDNDELSQLLASYRRDLGPGVQYRLNFMWAEWVGEAAGEADDNEGFAVTTSVRIAF